ncbi:MAG: helix-turn-helix domain-containing protein [Burkholderiales bacterium]
MTERISVGEELARARGALGLSLADVAQQLKFAPRQLEALEQECYERLPGGTYARGMVRNYARLLKLDPEPLIERIAAQVATPDNAVAVASIRRPIPITDSSKRVNLAYAALSLAILGAIAVVVVEWRQERIKAARLTFVPAAQAPLEPERAAVASTVTPQLAPLEAAEPRPASAEPAPAPGKHRIMMRFERESWVEIRGRDGRALISRLNPAGSERTVEGDPPFTLVIGNAQHVRLSYDDQPIDLAPHVKVEVARFTLE